MAERALLVALITFGRGFKGGASAEGGAAALLDPGVAGGAASPLDLCNAVATEPTGLGSLDLCLFLCQGDIEELARSASPSSGSSNSIDVVSADRWGTCGNRVNRVGPERSPPRGTTTHSASRSGGSSPLRSTARSASNCLRSSSASAAARLSFMCCDQ